MDISCTRIPSESSFGAALDNDVELDDEQAVGSVLVRKCIKRRRRAGSRDNALAFGENSFNERTSETAGRSGDFHWVRDEDGQKVAATPTEPYTRDGRHFAS